jgi:hypothetical protein
VKTVLQVKESNTHPLLKAEGFEKFFAEPVRKTGSMRLFFIPSPQTVLYSGDATFGGQFVSHRALDVR